jgi:hypothetical protein
MDHRATISNQEQHLALRAGSPQAVTIFAPPGVHGVMCNHHYYRRF